MFKTPYQGLLLLPSGFNLQAIRSASLKMFLPVYVATGRAPAFQGRSQKPTMLPIQRRRRDHCLSNTTSRPNIPKIVASSTLSRDGRETLISCDQRPAGEALRPIGEGRRQVSPRQMRNKRPHLRNRFEYLPRFVRSLSRLTWPKTGSPAWKRLIVRYSGRSYKPASCFSAVAETASVPRPCDSPYDREGTCLHSLRSLFVIAHIRSKHAAGFNWPDKTTVNKHRHLARISCALPDHMLEMNNRQGMDPEPSVAFGHSHSVLLARFRRSLNSK